MNYLNHLTFRSRPVALFICATSLIVIVFLASLVLPLFVVVKKDAF